MHHREHRKLLCGEGVGRGSVPAEDGTSGGRVDGDKWAPEDRA